MSKPPTQNIRVKLRFFGDLNNFLYKNYQETTFERTLPEPTSVKDLIEGCGVPHTEVDVILINTKPGDFSHKIEGGEQVSIYPFFSSVDIDESTRLLKPELLNPKFVVDVNLGKLARHLRMAGFDTAYQNDSTDEELIEIMLEEGRTLLTRDRKLLMRNVVQSGYLPRSDQADEQLEEVLKRFNLFDKVHSYTRCINCNGVLKKVSKEKIIDQLEPLTKKYFSDFSQCPDCGQIYWKGSHRNRLHPKVQEILGLD